LDRQRSSREHRRVHRFLRAPFSGRAWRELAYVWASLALAVAGCHRRTRWSSYALRLDLRAQRNLLHYGL